VSGTGTIHSCDGIGPPRKHRMTYVCVHYTLVWKEHRFVKTQKCSGLKSWPSSSVVILMKVCMSPVRERDRDGLHLPTDNIPF
jgi:hypothetical protein